VVVLQEDIETAFEISSIAFEIPYNVSMSCVKEFYLSMATVENDYLVETFSENYMPGSLVEVYYSDSLVLSEGPAAKLVLELDTPFFYNGEDNLLIDIYYPQGSCWCSNYGWQAGTARCVYDFFYPGGSGNPTGQTSDWLPYMVLEGTQSLEQSTFAAIKVMIGRYGD